MKKILVPCDFSKPATQAFQFALDIATQSKGTILLLHVIDLPIMHDTVLMPVLSFEEALLKELREKKEDQFEKLISKYNKTNAKVNAMVSFGSPSLVINDFANDNDIDLIVMGSHGATGLREIFIGSNTERTIRQAKVPVLVVKDYFKGPIKNIVFPNTLDTENQTALLQKVKALQSFFKATIHVVWINTPLNFYSDTITRDRLKAFVKRFMLKDYTINIFNHTNEEDGILQFTNFIKGDMIAMGTSSRKGLGHLINGSIAEDVANHTDKLIWSYSLKNELVEA